MTLQPSGQALNIGLHDKGSMQERQRRKSSIIVRSHIYNTTNNINPNYQDAGQSRRIVTSANTLSVNQPHMTHRRSFIGRHERTEARTSSFQAQRLSDVGIAVGQQITAKMGLKLPASQERVVEQTRWLFLRYLFDKLRQKSLPLRDLNLTKSLQARRAKALGLSMKNVQSSLTLNLPISSSISERHARRTDRFRRCQVKAFDESAQQFDNSSLNCLSTALDHCDLSANREDTNNASKASLGNLIHNPFTSLPSRKYIMDPTINNQILAVIMNFVRELHEAQPELYDDSIYELIGIDKFTSLETLLEVQKTISQEMIRSEISWSRIVTLFSLFGAMSLDCVRLGSPENVGPLLDGFIGFVERDLSLWISQQGGWESFLYKYRSGTSYSALMIKVMIVCLPLIVWAVMTSSSEK